MKLNNEKQEPRTRNQEPGTKNRVTSTKQLQTTTNLDSIMVDFMTDVPVNYGLINN